MAGSADRPGGKSSLSEMSDDDFLKTVQFDMDTGEHTAASGTPNAETGDIGLDDVDGLLSKDELEAAATAPASPALNENIGMDTLLDSMLADLDGIGADAVGVKKAPTDTEFEPEMPSTVQLAGDEFDFDMGSDAVEDAAAQANATSNDEDASEAADAAVHTGDAFEIVELTEEMMEPMSDDYAPEIEVDKFGDDDDVQTREIMRMPDPHGDGAADDAFSFAAPAPAQAAAAAPQVKQGGKAVAMSSKAAPAKAGGSFIPGFLSLLGIAVAGGVIWLGMQMDIQLSAMESSLQVMKQAIFNPTSFQQKLDAAEQKLTAAEIQSQAEKKEARSALQKPKGAGKAPASKRGGVWAVYLASFDARSAADRLHQKLQKQGVECEVVPHMIKGTTWYRVRVVGFADKAEARAYAKKFSNDKELKDAWVGRQ